MTHLPYCIEYSDLETQAWVIEMGIIRAIWIDARKIYRELSTHITIKEYVPREIVEAAEKAKFNIILETKKRMIVKVDERLDER